MRALAFARDVALLGFVPIHQHYVLLWSKKLLIWCLWP